MPTKTASTNKIEAARVLATHQSHWLERLAMPVMSTVFSLSVMHAAAIQLGMFLPEVSLPRWTLWVGLVFSIEGVYLSPLLVKVRAPATLRFFEAAIPCVAGVFLNVVFGPWSFCDLSWELLKNPSFSLPPAMILLSWYLASSAGHRLASLGNIAGEMGDQAASTLSWEEESLLSSNEARQNSAVEWFTRRVLFYVFAMCFLSMVVFESRAVDVEWQRLTAGSTGLLLLSGFTLQACVHLYRMQSIWSHHSLSVSRDLTGRWFVNTLAIGLSASLIALFLPYGFSPLSLSTIAGLFRLFMSRFLTNELPRQIDPPDTQEAPPPPEPIVPDVPEFSWLTVLLTLLHIVLPILLAAVALLALVGALILSFLGREWERLQGISRIPVVIYLWVKQTANILLLYVRKGIRWGRRQARKMRFTHRELKISSTEPELESMANPTPGTPAAYVRKLFVLLIRNATRWGLKSRPEQTPLEYADLLKKRLEGVDDDLEFLVGKYNEARYSRHDVSELEKPRVLGAWNRIINTMRERFGKQ